METTLKIEGMTCGHCQKAVHQALLQVVGVESVQVDLEAKQARVSGNADREAMRQALEEEGFSLAAE